MTSIRNLKFSNHPFGDARIRILNPVAKLYVNLDENDSKNYKKETLNPNIVKQTVHVKLSRN